MGGVGQGEEGGVWKEGIGWCGADEDVVSDFWSWLGRIGVVAGV